MKSLKSVKSSIFSVAHALTRDCLSNTLEFVGEYHQIFKIMLKRAHALYRAPVVEEVSTTVEVIEAEIAATVLPLQKSSIDGDNIFTELAKFHPGKRFGFILEVAIARHYKKPCAIVGKWYKELMESDIVYKDESGVYYYSK